jgi:16S rRNA (adenine1518-N6/adenine1519-N6)-dimethyltransferase
VVRYRAKKRFGQNFLSSEQIARRIVELLEPGFPIVEIGPGRGALTVPLAEMGESLIAVEFDRDLINHLKKVTAGYGNVAVVNADFLTFEPPKDLVEFSLIGNIPYNITSPVIDWCLRYRNRLHQVVLMVQKELARRITSQPGSKDWSPLSIFTQLAFETEYRFEVSPRAFIPPPEVTSAVVDLRPRSRELPADYAAFERVIRASFRHRRKLLKNNLVPDIIPDDTAAHDILEHIGLSGRSRAEQVTIDQFLKLTHYLLSRNMIVC